jgi:glycosyltransferase involved in cell wall biosynthesis
VEKHPVFSVIIPTYNRPQSLAACLHSLLNLDYPRGGFEVIVVDDGGEEPLGSVISSFSSNMEITLIRQSRTGPAEARNQGAALAKGKFLVFLDDDCEVSSDWLKKLEAHFASVPQHAVCGRSVNLSSGNPYAVATQLLADYFHAYYNAEPAHARHFSGATVAFPAESFHAVGGFSRVFSQASTEDRELCDRWLFHGYGILCDPSLLMRCSS